MAISEASGWVFVLKEGDAIVPGCWVGRVRGSLPGNRREARGNVRVCCVVWFCCDVCDVCVDADTMPKGGGWTGWEDGG